MIRVLKENGMAYISITRSFSRRDKREVDAKEWRNILSRFKVIKEGSSLFERWALVKKLTLQ